MTRFLVTGGAGFVGAHLALAAAEQVPNARVVAFDNLARRGSEFNLVRLDRAGVDFVHGDVRVRSDLERAGAFDVLLECSAEPSVLAGADGSPEYVIGTNLLGAVNCAEACRHCRASMIFLSSSRVYPLQHLRACRLRETETRYELDSSQELPGVSERGIAETFPMDGARSYYGASKYAAEVLLEEYRAAACFPVVINRCGVLAGPWQFGKADQGILTFWTAGHFFRQQRRYIGFGGNGRQVRDILHIDDLSRLILQQIEDPAAFAEGVYNVGGGHARSVSLQELTALCREATGVHTEIGREPAGRYADIPVFITDNGRISAQTGWQPRKTVRETVDDVTSWLRDVPAVHHLFTR